ncbi:alpha/beta hydrolase [Sulfobacillus harzensis]|uniref:Alpha/beta hydrolase n=1 Tax=Sulfobacillus harzensis TaxID=2729629 RepID=A0A7Y0Q1Q1_9FIRM|nr:alpha/beta hydrolase [Sulfobacillus harzensis]NMP21692.1 alpha/beta hydrolase [Sulfobacillus harzensis]
MARSLEVQWTLGSTRVFGTLTMPEGPGPFAAVVMAAGSGPTDRDWKSPLLPGHNGSARLLAEALADAGYASLRYDKRAAGPHAVENMQVLAGSLSMESHREEYAGAVSLLASRPDIRAEAIVGLGHSEGTLHVLHYQLERPSVPLAGMILAAPPGRAVGVVARWQLAAQAAAIPHGDALLDLYDQAIARFLAGRAAEPDSTLPDGVKQLIAGLESPANLPFSRELWGAESASLVAQVAVPTLIVTGKKDIQVDWELDGAPLEAASQGMSHITLRYPDHANHALKYEPKGRSTLNAADVAAAYNAGNVQLDPETLTMILDWLRSKIPQP